MWWIFALLSAFFAALTAIFAKIGIANVNTNLATAIRTIVILIIAWGIVFIRGEQKMLPLISKQNLLFLIASGITTGLSWIFYFKALQTGKVAQVASVDKLSVALAIIFSIIFLREVVETKVIVGALFILAGTIIIIK